MTSRARRRGRRWLAPGSEEIQVSTGSTARVRALTPLSMPGVCEDLGSATPGRPGGSAPQFYQEWRWRPPERRGPALPSPKARGREATLAKNASSSSRRGSSWVTGKRAEIDGHRRLHAETHGVFAGVIERDVFMRLKQAQLADALGGDAAGGEIGDAAAGKLEPHVGDIHFGSKDGDSRGADLLRAFRRSAPARCRYRESSDPAPRPRPGCAGVNSLSR